MPESLLDWKTFEAECLAVMRANTARWRRQGIIVTSEDVQIRAAKKLTDPGKRIVRKAHA